MPPKTVPKIPDGMVNLMKDLAKNVLKEQPENIYVFAAEYFEHLIRERDGSLDKGYETFRQYEEDLKRRKNENSIDSNVSAGPSASDATGMEVQGVAIKAKPRESKLAKLPMNRKKRLDAAKSESQDSAIDDEGMSSSPQVAPETVTVADQGQPQQTAMDIGRVVEHMPRVMSSKKSAQNLNAIEEESNADVYETQVVAASVVQTTAAAQMVASDDLEQSETPTFDTSLSDALTVIELDPIDEVNEAGIDGMKNEIVETHVVATSDDDDAVRKTSANEETFETKDVSKLHAIPNIDRLQTPESDSGLSEKSFNLKVQENEEIVVDEDNTIGDAESLNFSADIDISKDNADHIDTPENNENMKGDESESPGIAIETGPDENVPVEGDFSSITAGAAADESDPNENEEASRTIESENVATTIESDHIVDGVEKVENASIGNPDEKNAVNPDIEVETETIERDIEESHENNSVKLENADSADAGDHIDGQIDGAKEIVNILPANSVDIVTGSDTPASTVSENRNEEMTRESEEASSEPWQSALDDLAEKVNEIDANQKRIVKKIRHEAEKETEAALHPDKVGSHHSIETHQENASKSESKNDDDEFKLENVPAKSLDEADKQIDPEKIEQNLVIDNGGGESAREASISNGEKVNIGEDITDQVSLEPTVDSLGLNAAEDFTESANAESDAKIEQSEQSENCTVNVVIEEENDSKNEPTVEAINDTIHRVPIENSIQNELQTVPPLNESQESVDGSDPTAISHELAEVNKTEGVVKQEMEAGADKNDEIITEIEVKSDDISLPDKAVIEAESSKPLSPPDDPSKGTMNFTDETSNVPNAVVKSEVQTIELIPTDELVEDSQESNPINDNNEVLPKDENQVPLLKEQQNAEEKENKNNSQGDVETKIIEEMNEKEFANTESEGNDQAAHVSKHIEGKSEIPEAKSKELVEGIGSIGSQDNVGIVDNDNAASNESASAILLEMEAAEKIINSLENAESAANNLEAPIEPEPEKMDETDSNATGETPVGVELNIDVDLKSNKVEESDVSGQTTTDSGNEIQPVGISESDVVQNSSEGIEDVANSNFAANIGAPILAEGTPLPVTAAEPAGEFVSPIIAAMRNNEYFLNVIHSPRTKIDKTTVAEALENEEGPENALTLAGDEKQHSEIDGDGMSEISASNEDESFEHAETVIIGDESVKDIDILTHDDSENATAECPNVEENAAKELSNDQIEPDSLDMLADSLDVSLEPSIEPDSLFDSTSIDSLEAKAITTIVAADVDGAKADSAASIDETMPSLNLSSIEDETESVGNTVKVAVISPKSSGSTIKQPLGDVVNDKNNFRNFNEQMKNQLAALDNVEQLPSIPIQIFNIQEVDSPLTPNPVEMTFDLPHTTNKNVLFEENDKSIEQMVREAAAELTPLKSAESVGIAEKKASDTEAGPMKPSFSISHDLASSDLSDTDTDKEKVEKKFSESGVDESSRDERDEVSEVENFDLSSCGEDSLEAMYYQIRKNEILVDKGKQKTTDTSIGDDKIAFPGKATENLEQAFREVSGKRSLQSMESSTDDIIVCQLSTDTDGMHLISGGENESETDTSDSYHRPAVAPTQLTDEEFMNPIAAAIQRNQQLLQKMHSVASHQYEEPELEQENDHFPSGYSMDVDDMNVGNIRRKILASSMSEADSDYFEHQPSAAETHRLTKDDFNISTAFEHMIRNDSTTDSESTIESAATKIQAGARGFLTRRRLRRSSAGTSASVEKHSSIGNAAIDKSLDDHVENNAYKLLEHLGSDETVDGGGSTEDTMIGIIGVKMEPKKPYNDNDAAIANIIISESHPAEEGCNENESDENDTQAVTAQRRLTLQRGDAMQRYSTPDESSEALSHQSMAALVESRDPVETDGQKHPKSTKLQQSNASRSDERTVMRNLLGPRQRSMPVQIEMQLLRVLPKHRRKRVKSAASANSTKRKM